ncbi:hypothetical protein BpHYR1_029778 [Brachionus plicatilis]|uniref:Uncharacterized protein n=1 Tax=Brachionus plicatilis TaxID=10195 RepID=A0A3M7PYJ9_BRAPC|nr:hypothetical protein BpHYR1_029778 [Brachionus plicatilis]
MKTNLKPRALARFNFDSVGMDIPIQSSSRKKNMLKKERESGEETKTCDLCVAQMKKRRYWDCPNKFWQKALAKFQNKICLKMILYNSMPVKISGYSSGSYLKGVKRILSDVETRVVPFHLRILFIGHLLSSTSSGRVHLDCPKYQHKSD